MNAFSSCGVDPIEKAWKSAWRQSTHILCNKVFFWIHILEVPNELFKSVGTYPTYMSILSTYIVVTSLEVTYIG